MEAWGGVLAAICVFFSGFVFGIVENSRYLDRKAIDGIPFIVDNKVYIAVEQPDYKGNVK